MANSKSLGNSYEREFIKKLSKWMLGTDEKLVAWRNIHSGSISTIMEKNNKDGSNLSGDFQCLMLEYQPFFDKFHIDSKSYKEMNFCMINEKNQKSNSILNQWKKTVDESLRAGKIAMMPVKIRDRKTPEMIFMPFGYVDLNYFFNLGAMIYIFENLDPFYNCVVILQDFFFNKVTYEDFWNFYKEKNVKNSFMTYEDFLEGAEIDIKSIEAQEELREFYRNK